MIFSFTATILSCGLDTFYSLEPPVNIIHEAMIDNNDALQNYVAFQTNDLDNKSLTGFDYQGTAVYYKIYTSSDSVKSFRVGVDSVNNSSNYNTAANRIISAGYKEIGTLKDGNYERPSPLVKNSDYPDNAYVYIRLTNYNSITDVNPDKKYTAAITIAGSSTVSEISTSLIPVRENKNYKFDFGRYSKYSDCPVPASGDSDFSGGSSSNGTYYVDLYAFAVGKDTTFVRYYSNVLHLGTIIIRSNNENNF